jgi:putative ABC transport system permease protein
VSALSVALRLARRDVRRSRGRSALVVAMIALPVLGVTATDVLYRSFQLSEDQRATRQMGRADALLTDSGQASVTQLPAFAGTSWNSIGDVPRRRPAPPFAAVLPAGSRVLPIDQVDSPARVSTGSVTTTVGAFAVDLSDPLTQGLYVRRTGRPARAANEVVVTGGLARRIGLRLGDRVELALGTTTSGRTVVGTVESPGALDDRSVLLPAGSLPRTASSRVLVDVPGELTWQDVRRANAQGFLLETRGRVPGQPEVPAEYAAAFDKATLTAITLVVGMALLEVVLLAGPAFAVGAKRRTRELALLSATGADRKDVRRTVLAGGVVLGGLGGVLGVLGGLGLVLVAQHPLERLNGALFASFEVRPLEVLAVAAAGVLTAVLAAVVPARTAARSDVVAGLTGRRGVVRGRKRVPVLGVLAAGTGAAVALAGAPGRNVNLILAGSAIAELGLVATTPFLVGLAGRTGRLLPLAPRLALRDAARNRGRTAPAVSAILAAVAGSVAIATVVASFDERDRKGYTPQAPYGTSWVLTEGQPASATAVAVAAMRQHLPAARVGVVRALRGTQPFGEGDGGYIDIATRSCTTTRDGMGVCGGYPGGGAFYGPLVGDAGLLEALTGVHGEALAVQRRALEQGGAVVPADGLQPDGTVVIQVHAPGTPDGPRVRAVRVRAVAAPAGVQEPVLLSPAAAARVGVPVVPIGAIASAAQPPTGEEEDRLRGALRQVDLDGMLSVERGYRSEYAIGLLALLVGSAVIVLGASGIATGLAAADGRADLATLAAVGATPRTRRVLAAFQSAVTAGLGTVLGTIAGMVPAIAILRAMTNTVAVVDGHAVKQAVLPIVLPWTNIVTTLLLVPLLAALAAALLTRSRLPMVRRVG